MTQDTPGVTAGEPAGGAKTHKGKVVHSTDGKTLTDPDAQGRPAGGVADERQDEPSG